MRLKPIHTATWIQAGVVIALAVWLWGKIVSTWLVHLWGDPNYSFGLLTVPVATWLAWRRRQELHRIPKKTSYWGLAFTVFALTVLLAGTLGSELFLSRISFVLFLFGISWYVGGWGHVKLLALPLGLLVLAIPLPEVVFNQVAFPLQLLASHIATVTLDVFGVPVLREGNIITLPKITLGVAEACSGLRSGFSLLALSVIYGQLCESENVTRMALVATAIPIAVLVNSIRVTGTGLLAQYVTAHAAESFFHGFYGWLLFGVALVLLVVTHKVYGLAARILQRQDT